MTVSSKKKLRFTGRIVSVSVEDVVLPNGATLALERVHHPGGAVVIALDDQQRICLLKQYRYIAQEWLWELPAGKIDEGESPDSTARRELTEETGARARDWTALGKAFSSPGIFEEVLHFYLAKDLQRGEPAFDEHEVIEIHWLPLAEAFALLDRGDIVDGKTIIGLCKLRRHLRIDAAMDHPKQENQNE